MGTREVERENGKGVYMKREKWNKRNKRENVCKGERERMCVREKERAREGDI